VITVSIAVDLGLPDAVSSQSDTPMARPFIPVPFVASVELVFELDGRAFSNVFHFYSFETEWTLPDLVTLAGQVGTWCINSWLIYMSNEVSFTKAIATALYDELAPNYTFTYSSYVGSQPAPSLPLNCAIWIPLTALRRAGEPSYHVVFGGIPNSVVEGNIVGFTFRDLLRATLVTLIDLNTTLHSQWVRISYETGGVWRSEGFVTFVGNIGIASERLGSRRTRLHNNIPP